MSQVYAIFTHVCGSEEYGGHDLSWKGNATREEALEKIASYVLGEEECIMAIPLEPGMFRHRP